MTEPVAAVEIRGVTKRFGSIAALDNVSLDIRRGEFFSLLGPSGCGKTTLLRLIGGFENPTAGDVLIDGQSMLGLPPYLRSTNMIFQHLALFPHMNVFDNIAFGLRMKRVARAEIGRKVAGALALVRLEGFEGRSVEQLSGGQKQRVAIARALVNNPSVLLLDEPLGALDLQLRIQMTGELRRLHGELHSTFIFVTHDQGEAMTMSNRVAVMNLGRVEQVGTPEEIYETPATRFVATFIGHNNLLEGRVVQAEGENWYGIDCAGLRVRCRSRKPLDAGAPVTLALRYEKIEVAPPRADAGRRSHQAEIMQKTYMGATLRFSARTAGGLVLTADVANVDKAKALNEGDTVELSWPDDAAIVLSD
ncbi:MAG: ABC transporter ATP-binding protein [Proteobacteria bacterium]|nr:ABC transporter ATP-binding protein [Pseudomonadota bacterium]